MRFIRSSLVCLLLFFIVLINSYGQLYPVQSTSQLIPPYSVYLSDYATPGSEKLRVILVQRDLTQPSYLLRLVMTVELNGSVILRTSRTYNPAPISLSPGIPTIISGAELAPYLDSHNIDFVGFSREQYERTKALPEGSYQITFTAYDYHRQDVRVSNEGASFYYLSKNEPPLTNMPACGTQIPMRTPQQIVFTWLPRNTASPNSAAETQYEFALYETRPAGRNPNDVVLTTNPVFKTTVDFPQLVYGPTEPLLLENMKYVWRVRAIDINGKDAFRNNGYSEVCTFTYGGVDPNFNIGVVKDLQAEGETERRAKIWWTAGDYDAYRINYKKTGNSYEWFTSEITKEQLTKDAKTDGELKLFDLEPDMEYETRVQGRKSGVLGDYTDIVKFRTKPLRVAVCGDPVATPLTSGKPLLTASRGTIIIADDMPIMLMDVVHLGNGFYQGTGRVGVAYFRGASFGVKFDRLFIDENREAGVGRIDFITKGVAAMMEEQLANQQKRKDEKKQRENRDAWAGTEFYDKVFVYDQMDIVTITPGGASVVNITDLNGTVTANAEVMQVLNTVPDKAIIIQDKSGDQFVVQKNKDTGEVKVTKVEGGGLTPGSSDTSTLASNPIKERIIILILEQFEEEIGAWLRMNGKGGEDDPDVLLSEALPSCFEKDVRFLSYVDEKIIPYFKENPVELRYKIESDQTKEILFTRIAKLFKNKEDVDWTKFSESDQEALTSIICEAINESTLVIIDRLIACLAGATIDVGLQYTFKWVELWMDDKPANFTDYEAVFGNLDASQLAVSASIACAAAMIPIIPSSKNKLIIAVTAGLGDGAFAMANNIYKQYDDLQEKYPDASVGDLISRIKWQEAVQEGGVNFVITGISTGVVLYAKGNPKFIGFAKKLEDKIKASGSTFLEKAGLGQESIDLLLNKLGIKNIKTFLLQLPKISVNIQSGNINVTDHWTRYSTSFNLDENIAQQIRRATGSSVASLAEQGVIKQFTENGFISFVTKYGGNNGLDALLANSTDLAKATRIILLEIKSSTTNTVPFSIKLGAGYGGYQLDDTWLDGVITKMIGEDDVNKTIQAAGKALRRIYDNNAGIIEKYIIEVDNNGLAKIIKIE